MAKPDWVGEYGATYEGLIESAGITILEWFVTGSYQGDYVTLLEKDGKYAYEVIGYGSCSGCDALEAATPWLYGDEDWSGVVELRDELVAGILWYADPLELADLLAKKWEDADGTFWYTFDTEIRDATQTIIDRLRSLGGKVVLR